MSLELIVWLTALSVAVVLLVAIVRRTPYKVRRLHAHVYELQDRVSRLESKLK